MIKFTKSCMLTLLVGACFLPALVESQPTNDPCTSATTLMLDGSTSVGTTNGSSPFIELSSCGPQRDVETPAVWYTFLGQGRRVTVSTCFESTEYFTSVYAWKGSCNQASLRCISGSFGDFGCSSPNGASVTFNALEDVTYSILVSGRERNDTGSFQISANQGDYLSVINNDTSSSPPTSTPFIDSKQTHEPTTEVGTATGSPTALEPCANELQTSASLSILTGTYAEYIDVLLTDLSTNETVWDSKGAVYLRDELYTFVECLHPSNCYRFYIGSYGDSSYRFSFDGIYLTSNSDDEKPSSVYYVGGGCTTHIGVPTNSSIPNTTPYDSVEVSGATRKEYLAVVCGGIALVLMDIAA